MGRCRGVPFEFPNILIRLLSSPRRAGGRTNKMNTNYLNTNYKSNERALADLLGQLVRGRNSSPTNFNRGGGGGGGGGSVGMSGGGGGPMNNYSGSSMGMNSGGGGGWGGNQPNNWNQGSGGFGNSGGGFGNGRGSGNLMPLMQRGGGMNLNNSGGGGGFGGMSQGGGYSGMNDNFGMQQGNNYMGMSGGGNSGGFGDMPSNLGMNMNTSGFGGRGGFGGFGGGDGYGDCPPALPIRSRGTWVSGSANRSNRIAPLVQGRSSNRPSSSTQDRRSLSGSKASLSSSRNSRSGGGAASGSSSRPVQAQKRKAPPSSVSPAKASNNTSNAKPTSAQGDKTISEEPRRVLTSVGGRWYQHFLTKGLKPEEARKKAFENNNKPFPAGVDGTTASKNRSRSARKPNKPPVDKYVRVAIFAKGFPENLLDPEDLSSLEEMIVDEIVNNSTETKLQFERLLHKPGMIFVDCINQQTADWLKELIPKLPHWENPELEVCSEDNIPQNTYVMTLSLPKSVGQEYDQTLAYIQAQNADLCTDSWEWVQEREDGDRLTLTIRVDEQTHTAIRERRWKIFYRFSVIEVSFIRYIRQTIQAKLKGEEQTTKQDESKAEEEQQTEESSKAETAADLTEEANPPSPPPAPVISK